MACTLLCIFKLKRKLENGKQERATGHYVVLLNSENVYTCTFNHFRIHRHAYFTEVCTDMDLPDKGHLCFVYFVEATVFVGCVQQSISSFNGLKSEKLKWGVSACLAPCGAENVQ